jgi:hypothetical protein
LSCTFSLFYTLLYISTCILLLLLVATSK